MSALRTRAGLKLRVVGRLTTLTSPSNAQVRATVQTASGATLAVLPWVQLGSDTSAQFVDFGATTLDALRVPLSNTTSVIILGEIRSLSGSVTATLSYIEALLYYWVIRMDAEQALQDYQAQFERVYTETREAMNEPEETKPVETTPEDKAAADKAAADKAAADKKAAKCRRYLSMPETGSNKDRFWPA